MLKIQDIFYDKILKQIALGTVKVGDFIFNIGFDTIVKEDNKIIKEYHNSNDITLEIKDRKLFDEALEKYTKLSSIILKRKKNFKKLTTSTLMVMKKKYLNLFWLQHLITRAFMIFKILLTI